MFVWFPWSCDADLSHSSVIQGSKFTFLKNDWRNHRQQGETKKGEEWKDEKERSSEGEREKAKEKKVSVLRVTTGLVTHPSLSPLRDVQHAITLYRNLSLSLIKGDEWKTRGEQGVLSPEFYAVCDHHTLSHGTHMRNVLKNTHTQTQRHTCTHTCTHGQPHDWLEWCMHTHQLPQRASLTEWALGLGWFIRRQIKTLPREQYRVFWYKLFWGLGGESVHWGLRLHTPSETSGWRLL